jgi:hypothetical protein
MRLPAAATDPQRTLDEIISTAENGTGCVKTAILIIVSLWLAPRLQVISANQFLFSLCFIELEKLHWLNRRRGGHIQRIF